MSDPRITDEAVEAAAVAACEFVYPPKTDQSWGDVDDWEQDAWRATERVALEAALPHLTPQPVVDREALLDAIQPTESTGLPSRQRAIADAVMEVVRPMPTREALIDVLRGFAEDPDVPADGWVFFADEPGDIADAVLALLNRRSTLANRLSYAGYAISGHPLGEGPRPQLASGGEGNAMTGIGGGDYTGLPLEPILHTRRRREFLGLDWSTSPVSGPTWREV